MTGPDNSSFDARRRHRTGIIRDFQPSSFAQGHPDFEQSDPIMADKKYIAYCVELMLGDDGKPVFNSGGWKNSARRQRS